MYSVDHPTGVGDAEASLRAFLREAQRELRPAEVARRRQALRRVLAESMGEPPPQEPQELRTPRKPRTPRTLREPSALYLQRGAAAG